MTCDADPAAVWPDKHPNAKLQYGVDFEPECARQWAPYSDFATNTCIRVYKPGNSSGFECKAIIGGRSAGREPVFPDVDGATMRDGSITWQCQSLSSASLIRTINSTPTWSADDGITISGEALTGIVATAFLEGGDDDTDYTVTVSAAMSDGQVVPKVAVLPVRIPVRVCE